MMISAVRTVHRAFPEIIIENECCGRYSKIENSLKWPQNAIINAVKTAQWTFPDYLKKNEFKIKKIKNYESDLWHFFMKWVKM